MADNTPVVSDEKTSAPKVETQPEATTKEVEIPTFAKSTEQLKKEESVQTEATEVPAPQDEEETVLKKRLSGAISEVEKRNEEARRYVDLQAEIVRENNELIHKIAASDPILANKIVTKVWGLQNIRSYKQLIERSKLEELKTTNPDVYETKRELMDVKTRLAQAEEKEQKVIRGKFLESKGILANEYDPNYRKLMEAFDSVNPSLVSEDYERALRSAYSIAFAEERPIPRPVEVPTMLVGGGKKPAPLPKEGPKMSDQSSWLAESLNKKLGYKIQL